MQRTEVSRILTSGKRPKGFLGRNHGRRDRGSLFTTKVLMGLLALGLACFGCSFKVVATALAVVLFLIVVVGLFWLLRQNQLAAPR